MLHLRRKVIHLALDQSQYKCTFVIHLHKYIMSLGFTIPNALYLHKYILVHTNYVLERTRWWLRGYFLSILTCRIQVHICNKFFTNVLSLSHIACLMLYICMDIYWCTPTMLWKEPDDSYMVDSSLYQPPEYKCSFVIHLHKCVISVRHSMPNTVYLHKYLLVHTNYNLKRTRWWLYGCCIYVSTSRI